MFHPLKNDIEPLHAKFRRPTQRFILVGVSLALALSALSGCSDDDPVAAASGGDAGEGGEPSGGEGGEGGEGGTSAGGAGGEGGEGGEPSEGGAGGAGGVAGMAGAAGMPEYDGQTVFRHDTFGDERVWTDVLQMHEVIASSVSPLTALAVGLKVDAEVLPEGILEQVDLDDPATTVALLELDAVVGVKGTVEDGELVSVGITCALCHSDVDDSVMEGIGVRIDGPANRDLDPGAILALSPAFADEASQEVLTSWGPGRFDPRFNQDGINHPVLIPPIYGLADVPLGTYTGDGPISYWNSYVAVTQMGGQGQFYDPRIDVAVFMSPDMVTAKLPVLFEYQVSLEAPEPPADSFDAAAAVRGQALFEGAAACAGCHSGPQLTDAGERLHTPAAVGQEPMTAERSATGRYRTTPLRALFDHPPYFHDGSAATLADVVVHYNTHLGLALTAPQQADLVEYLKSL